MGEQLSAERETFRDRLVELLKLSGLTQQQVVNQVSPASSSGKRQKGGLTEQVFSTWKCGDHLPGKESLSAVLRVLIPAARTNFVHRNPGARRPDVLDETKWTQWLTAAMVAPKSPRETAADDADLLSSADTWIETARDRLVWKVASEPDLGLSELRDAALILVGRLHRRYVAAKSALRDDPWFDEDLPLRIANGIETLLGTRLQRLELSPAEAALLTVVPFLRATDWAVRAVGQRPDTDASTWLTEPVRPSTRLLNQVAQARPRLSRMSASSPGAATAIGWWTFHRLLDRERVKAPATDQTITSLVGTPPAESPLPVPCLLADVLSPGRLAEILRVIDGDLVRLTDHDHGRPPAHGDEANVGCGGTAQKVRKRLVAFCLMLSAAMALDPGTLGPVIVEHVGGADGVPLDQMRATVSGSRWNEQGKRLVLSASCPHEAVEIALRERAEQVTEILDAVHKAAKTADVKDLSALPARASGDDVVAAQDAHGKAAYVSPGMRFRVDDDKVRELLMGENLYTDKALAIRELYQNALDACRYRQARTRWLNLNLDQDEKLEWDGSIRFKQGIDQDGRAYLECRDNGIGMGQYELRQVFSRAGARFVELPEFLEEQASWKEADIDFVANSRFGIGVLSYFMLADTVEITTCRLDSEGQPGDQLQVTIPGPGSLFRIHRKGRGRDAGTTARLYLNDPDTTLSCVNTLRKLLFVAEFRTEASKGPEQETWEPHQLSPYAIHLAERFESERRSADTGSSRLPKNDEEEGEMIASAPGDTVSAAPEAPVWWCRGTGNNYGKSGGILADGLWAGEALDCVFVNLTGVNAAELTVDRRSMRRYDKDAVRQCLRLAAPAVAKAPPPAAEKSIGSRDWLRKIAYHDRVAADIILSHLPQSEGWKWRWESLTVDPAVFGYLTSDEIDDVIWQESRSFEREFAPTYYERAGHVHSWRRMAWLAIINPASDERTASRPVAGRPSDESLLYQGTECHVSRANVVELAVRMMLDLTDVCERFQVLGYSTPSFPGAPAVKAGDARLVSVNADGIAPWLPDDQPVAGPHVLFIASRLRLPPGEVAARLAGFGFTAPGQDSLPDAVPTELDQLLRAVPGLPWRQKDDAPLARGYLVTAAAVTKRQVTAVARILNSFGFDVPDMPEPPTPLSRAHAQLVSSELNGKAPWLADDQPVSRAHLVRAAYTVGWNLRTAADALRELGYQVPSVTDQPVTVKDSDLRLIRDYSKEYVTRFIDDAPGALIGPLSFGALNRGQSVADMWNRLAELGYSVPVIPQPAEDITADDIQIASFGLNGKHPWIPDKNVPKAFIAIAAAHTRWSVHKVVRRLATLGYQIDSGHVPDELDDSIRVVLSRFRLAGSKSDDRGSDSGASTLALFHAGKEFIVSHAALLVTASTLDRPIGEVAETLCHLGFTCAKFPERSAEIIDGDKELLSLNLDGKTPWLPDGPVPLVHLIRAAGKQNKSVGAVAERLTELGYSTQANSADPSQEITKSDLLMIDGDKSILDESPWYHNDKEFSPMYLLGAAITLSKTVDEIAGRLTELGFRVSPVREFSSPGAYLRTVDEYRVREGRQVIASETQKLQLWTGSRSATFRIRCAH